MVFAPASLSLTNYFLPLNEALGVQDSMGGTDNKAGFIIVLASVFSLLVVVLSGQEQWLQYVSPLTFLWGLNCIWAFFNKKTIYSLYLPIAPDARIFWRMFGLFVGILLIVISVGMHT